MIADAAGTGQMNEWRPDMPGFIRRCCHFLIVAAKRPEGKRLCRIYGATVHEQNRTEQKTQNKKKDTDTHTQKSMHDRQEDQQIFTAGS